MIGTWQYTAGNPTGQKYMGSGNGRRSSGDEKCKEDAHGDAVMGDPVIR